MIIKIFKLFENGNLDTSFGIDGIIESQYDNVIDIRPIIKVDSNNKILNLFTMLYDDYEYSTSISRFNENGNIDSTFGENGTYDFNLAFFAHKIIIQPNSRILIGVGVPEFEGTAFILKRLFSNGSIDNSLVEFDYSYFESSDLILQNDGKILATGSTYWYDGQKDIVLVRFNNNSLGVEDHQFQNFTVHPNPSNGVFNITHDVISSETPYQITDITGKTIQKGELTGEQTIINLLNKQSGMYFLNTSGKTYKLIKN